jgi:hypothetical protein
VGLSSTSLMAIESEYVWEQGAAATLPGALQTTPVSAALRVRV